MIHEAVGYCVLSVVLSLSQRPALQHQSLRPCLSSRKEVILSDEKVEIENDSFT